MTIEHLVVPMAFDEYTEKTNRKFLIVGGKENPTLLAKSVYLCLKLAGPESITVRTDMVDDSLLVQNIFDYHGEGVKTRLFIPSVDDMDLSSEWRDAIEESTDIVVFGGKEAMEAFRDYETVDRRVWEHGYKFSFGVIRAEQLTAVNIANICFDFFSYYGEGMLAPKFYFIVGQLKKKSTYQFSKTMEAFYGSMIEEYRSRLPLTRQSDLIKSTVNSNYLRKYVRLENLHSDILSATLYGDIQLVMVDDLGEVSDFIEEWSDHISTVAINTDDDPEMIDLLEDLQVTRICQIGNMQFPDFFEQYNTVDDFNIYVKEDDDTFY